MRSHPWLSIVIIASLMACSVFSAGEVQAGCRNPNIVQDDEGPFLIPAAASGSIEIKWFGHSFFQITSSSGTKIITDPFGAMGFPMPEVWPNVVTVGREHGNHNNVGLAKGNPLILRGLKSGTEEWDNINIMLLSVIRVARLAILQAASWHSMPSPPGHKGSCELTLTTRGLWHSTMVPVLCRSPVDVSGGSAAGCVRWTMTQHSTALDKMAPILLACGYKTMVMVSRLRDISMLTLIPTITIP